MAAAEAPGHGLLLASCRVLGSCSAAAASSGVRSLAQAGALDNGADVLQKNVRNCAALVCSDNSLLERSASPPSTGCVLSSTERTHAKHMCTMQAACCLKSLQPRKVLSLALTEHIAFAPIASSVQLHTCMVQVANNCLHCPAR